MSQQVVLTHEFVEFIPDSLQEGIIYVSVQYATVVHRCCCGCRNEVITPLSPTDWKLIFDGHTITLDPSIGNWSFECRSHYWINRNQVRWATKWSQEMIDAGRAHDRFAKQRYYRGADAATEIGAAGDTLTLESRKEPGLWQKLMKWWRRS